MSNDYYGHFNSVLLGMIPDGLQSVLEFGCGAGALARQYLDRQSTRWVGVEAFSEAAAKAQTVMSACHNLDAEDLDAVAEALAGNRFDALVYADCLEHFRDPKGSLSDHVQYLAEGGAIYVSLPNAQHWTMLRELFEGRFNYQGEGLFDYTHLHFFTLSSTDAMFRALGFKRVIARPLTPVATAPLLGGSERRLPVLRAAATYFGRDLTPMEVARFDAYQIALEYRRVSES